MDRRGAPPFASASASTSIAAASVAAAAPVAVRQGQDHTRGRDEEGGVCGAGRLMQAYRQCRLVHPFGSRPWVRQPQHVAADREPGASEAGSMWRGGGGNHRPRGNPCIPAGKSLPSVAVAAASSAGTSPSATATAALACAGVCCTVSGSVFRKLARACGQCSGPDACSGMVGKRCEEEESRQQRTHST